MMRLRAVVVGNERAVLRREADRLEHALDKSAIPLR